MGKKSKAVNAGAKNTTGANQGSKTSEIQKEAASKTESGYLCSMGYAPKINEEYHWFQSVPIVAFSAIIILIVQMASYERSMQQFFWYSGPDDLTDFFSYYKMIGILVCAGLALLILLYRVFTQSFAHC